MLGWLECRSIARTRRSGVNRSCVLIAPISSTGAPGELGTRPRARSRRSTQRLVEWSDVFSAEASCCAAVPVGGCERGRGERAHAAHLVHAHAANLLKLLCDRRCLGRGASRLKAVEDAVVLARHSSCVPARSHPRGRRHDDHGVQKLNEGENGTNACHKPRGCVQLEFLGILLLQEIAVASSDYPPTSSLTAKQHRSWLSQAPR